MQRKYTAHPTFAAHREPASHGLGQVLADGKPQACSRNLGKPSFRTAVKRLKNLLQLRTMDADSTVPNADGNFLATLRRLQAGGDANALIDSSVLDSVGDQILQAAAHGRQITEHARQSRLDYLFYSARLFDD